MTTLNAPPFEGASASFADERARTGDVDVPRS